MKTDDLYTKALNFELLTAEEGVQLFEQSPLAELMFVADELRKKQVPYGKVTWQIDRNVNTTNVCVANCKFCNFYRIPGHAEAYITDIETYKKKIGETLRWGGDQLLLQGGHHPELGLQFYVDLFRVMTALQQQLIAAPAQGFPDLIGFYMRNIGFFVTGNTVELQNLQLATSHTLVVFTFRVSICRVTLPYGHLTQFVTTKHQFLSQGWLVRKRGPHRTRGNAVSHHFHRLDAFGDQSAPNRIAVGDNQIKRSPPAAPQFHLEHQRHPITKRQTAGAMANHTRWRGAWTPVRQQFCSQRTNGPIPDDV